MTAAAEVKPAARIKVQPQRIGSLSRRMIGVAALWIVALLLMGGFALDRVLSRSIVDSFDNQLTFVLNSMIASSEIGPDGEVRFNRPPADQRFVEPYSGLYFQISGAGAEMFPSRSLWDRRLRVNSTHADIRPHLYDSDEFSSQDNSEPLRIAERDAILPGSPVRWRFQIAQSRETINDQIHRLRSTLFWSFSALGVGLLVLATLQTFYGLWPLRRVRNEVSSIRSGDKTR
ncbi:MAG TPA: sensor histidine kinase N-terminal domain-containing protein, partial [Sphingomicrobium sp.]|nr:sensor histidine kinase N-terminal domain-containing protein [Sphingomicrobium sp.]